MSRSVKPPLTTTDSDLRSMMSGFPSGVSVVTSLAPGAVPRGMTCSSLVSVALSPPTVLVCLRSASPTLEAILAGGRFAVNLLHEGAHPVADLFASGAADRFDITDWRLPLGAAGPHLTAAAHAIADCAVVHTQSFGDHTAVFGGVSRVTVRNAEPLLYGRRRYARWSDAAAGPPPKAPPSSAVSRADSFSPNATPPADAPLQERSTGVR